MSNTSIQTVFARVVKPEAAPTSSQNPKRLPPLSFRVTQEEREMLKQAAGKKPVGAYIRSRLFGEKASPRKPVKRRPSVDDAAISKALAMLGQSRLSSNLNQIAKVANKGALPVTPSLLAELNAACADIRIMREALISALDIKSRE